MITCVTRSSAGRGVAGEDAITISGLAVTKRAYELFQQRRYESRAAGRRHARPLSRD